MTYSVFVVRLDSTWDFPSMTSSQYFSPVRTLLLPDPLLVLICPACHPRSLPEHPSERFSGRKPRFQVTLPLLFWAKNIMERQGSHHGHDDEHQQQRYVYGESFMARACGRLIDRLRGIENSVNSSTFGRVFRLDGSGHVGSCPPS